MRPWDWVAAGALAWLALRPGSRCVPAGVPWLTAVATGPGACTMYCELGGSCPGCSPSTTVSWGPAPAVSCGRPLAGYLVTPSWGAPVQVGPAATQSVLPGGAGQGARVAVAPVYQGSVAPAATVAVAYLPEV